MCQNSTFKSTFKKGGAKQLIDCYFYKESENVFLTLPLLKVEIFGSTFIKGGNFWLYLL